MGVRQADERRGNGVEEANEDTGEKGRAPSVDALRQSFGAGENQGDVNAGKITKEAKRNAHRDRLPEQQTSQHRSGRTLRRVRE